MKAKFSLLLSFLLLISLLGCTATGEDSHSYRFYYCREALQYGTGNGVIHSIQYAMPPSADADDILARYLEGTDDKDFVSPFPANTKLISMKVSTDTVEIVLSQEFSQLTQVDLTIACACLTMTISNITGCQTVEIFAADSSLNNQRSVIMDVNSIMTSDMITGS